MNERSNKETGRKPSNPSFAGRGNHPVRRDEMIEIPRLSLAHPASWQGFKA